VKAALHVHSTYSDGDLSLPELRGVYLRLGCRVVCMTDHAEAFGEETLLAYVAECEALSDDRLQFVAGFEYSCRNGMHVLGFGVASRVASREPQDVIRHVKDTGGIAVVAHPKITAFDWIEAFDELPHGIEAWNTKYDGRHAPRTATFELVRRLRVREPSVHAFYGQDMHFAQQPRRLYTILESECATRRDVLLALRDGRYFGVVGRTRLPPDGALAARTVARFDRTRTAAEGIRHVARAARRLAERFGVPIPPHVTAQARRML